MRSCVIISTVQKSGRSYFVIKKENNVSKIKTQLQLFDKLLKMEFKRQTITFKIFVLWNRLYHIILKIAIVGDLVTYFRSSLFSTFQVF